MKAILLLILFFTSAGLWAADPIPLVFYYPGGDGNTQQAAAIMALFGDELAKESGVGVSATYYSERLSPERLLPKRGRALILMRLDSYLEWPTEAPLLSPALVTEPVYEDPDDSERYRIYAAKSADPRPACEELLLGIDISKRFIAELFGSRWGSIKPGRMEDPLSTLEKLAATPARCVVLECRQWKAIDAFPFPWKESLQVVEESSPTLPPMVFTVGEVDADVRKVLAALQKFAKTDQEILGELQLKGFDPLSLRQQGRLSDWKARYEGKQAL